MTDPGIYYVWRRLSQSARTAVFLDRDGVIVEEVGYLHRREDIRMVEGAARAIKALNQLAIPVIIVTNQAGVGRGFYKWDDFEHVQAEIESRLEEQGAHVDAVYACAYHPDGVSPWNRDHDFRKPNPGMLRHAAATGGFPLERSWLVGDKTLDLEAAIAAGLAGSVLVRTGYGSGMEGEGKRLGAASGARIQVEDDLEAAVRFLLDGGWL